VGPVFLAGAFETIASTYVDHVRNQWPLPPRVPTTDDSPPVGGLGDLGGRLAGSIRVKKFNTRGVRAMLKGGHGMRYDRDAGAMRDFLKDVLALPAVDSGNDRWLMQVPPTEIGVHETTGDGGYEFYFQCDEIEATVAEIEDQLPAGCTAMI